MFHSLARQTTTSTFLCNISSHYCGDIYKVHFILASSFFICFKLKQVFGRVKSFKFLVSLSVSGCLSLSSWWSLSTRGFKQVLGFALSCFINQKCFLNIWVAIPKSTLKLSPPERSSLVPSRHYRSVHAAPHGWRCGESPWPAPRRSELWVMSSPPYPCDPAVQPFTNTTRRRGPSDLPKRLKGGSFDFQRPWVGHWWGELPGPRSSWEASLDHWVHASSWELGAGLRNTWVWGQGLWRWPWVIRDKSLLSFAGKILKAFEAKS